jgi:hypothetical protein
MNSNLISWAHNALHDSFLASMALALLLGSFNGVGFIVGGLLFKDAGQARGY